MIGRDLGGRWMLNIAFRGRSLRIFAKSLAKPYARRYLNMILFGAGPIGCMFWPKKSA